jgi:hypothetical protein
LGPAYLRIGGSLDKFVVYDVPGAAGACGNASAGRSALHSSCLNATRWDSIHAFAAATNAKIVMGLSYPQDAHGAWNASQAAALFAYSQSQSYDARTTLFGFELGEELTRFRAGSTDFQQYVEGYRTCAALLTQVFGAAPDRRPKLMGPCPGMAWPELSTWFPDFLNGTGEALDIAVYRECGAFVTPSAHAATHRRAPSPALTAWTAPLLNPPARCCAPRSDRATDSYNQIVPTPPRTLFLNVTVPSGNVSTQSGSSPGDTGWQGAAMRGFVERSAAALDVSPRPLWLGEFGPHNGGGGGVYASTFVSSFFYLDALGSLAALRHDVLARQTLVGGNYELLRCSSGRAGGGAPEEGAGCDFEPHPDYYVALMWRRLMGAAVLNGTVRWSGGSAMPASLRVHAHCTAGRGDGAVTVAWANMDEREAFDLRFSEALGAQRIAYHFAAANATEGMGARVLSLNGGVPLRVGDGAAPPPLDGRAELSGGSAAPLRAAPVSLGWAVFPDAKAAACKRDSLGA